MSTPPPPLPPGPHLVAGLGRAGRAAISALTSSTSERVLAWDGAATTRNEHTARRLRRLGVDCWLGGDGLQVLRDGPEIGAVIKSPGMSFDLPLLRHAAQRGVAILDELEVGWRLGTDPTVGVTGTNGKSTTCALVAALLSTADRSVPVVGNSEFGVPLSLAQSGGWVVCEVSSFQLEGAPSFLPDIAVLTNLTTEHLDRHGNMEHYGQCKRRMFVRNDRTAGTSVINVDDEFGRALLGDVTRAGGRAVGYGFAETADVRVLDVSWDMRTAHLRLRGPSGVIECESRLPGKHNASNIAAAFAVGEVAGIPTPEITRAIEAATAPPGRWELVDESQPFAVLVDYAHTPDAVRRVLEAARQALVPRAGGALRTVFGAVGASEPHKAREIGYWARALSDHLVLTTGSAPGDARIPRLAELRSAGTTGARVEVVLQRSAAIKRSLSGARSGDIVAILGLGALPGLVLDAAGTSCLHDDREVARAFLQGTAT